jgi:hypothetical protein
VLVTDCFTFAEIMSYSYVTLLVIILIYLFLNENGLGIVCFFDLRLQYATSFGCSVKPIYDLCSLDSPVLPCHFYILQKSYLNGLLLFFKDRLPYISSGS